MELNTIELNGQTVTTSQTAIVDSGTSLVTFPQDVAEALYAMIPGAEDISSIAGPGFFACELILSHATCLLKFVPVPCSSNVPEVTFVLGQVTLSLGDRFNLGLLAVNSPLCVGAVMGMVGLPSTSFKLPPMGV